MELTYFKATNTAARRSIDLAIAVSHPVPRSLILVKAGRRYALVNIQYMKDVAITSQVEFLNFIMRDITQEDFKTVPIADLVPTQVTVGMREVDFKRRRWREKSGLEAANYLNTHRFPVVLGPGARHYLIDRHHLTHALHNEGVWSLPVSIVANLSELSFDAFWTTLESHNWTHPFDNEGRRCSYDDMPPSVDDLVDDPFRSLAGALKRAGGYAKDKAPFSEFRWADFLRYRIPRDLVEHHFGRALVLAMNLAESTQAAALPGWRRHPVDIPHLDRLNRSTWANGPPSASAMPA